MITLVDYTDKKAYEREKGEAMEDVLLRLQSEGVPFFLESYSALDRYFRVKEPGSVYLLTDSSLVSLARIFENLEYPGMPLEDACVEINNRRCIFRCVDSIEDTSPHPFTAQDLLYNVAQGSFLDPRGIYGDLRRENLVAADIPVPMWLTVMEAAKLVSRYHYEVDNLVINNSRNTIEQTETTLRELLIFILSSRYSEKGLSLLDRHGFIELYWPELHAMTRVQHSKEFHPEGNVWEHTLESLRYRKGRDLTLSMALLLHDIGKPVAKALKEKPFKNHAELGAVISESFLRHLGFATPFIRDVCFLIHYHMLPAALVKMPLYRIEKIMDSRLFPSLLELFRADISATFRGPDKYYEACRVYKTYLKRRKNPYKRLKRNRLVG